MPGSSGRCSSVTAHNEDRELTWSLLHAWQLLHVSSHLREVLISSVKGIVSKNGIVIHVIVIECAWKSSEGNRELLNTVVCICWPLPDFSYVEIVLILNAWYRLKVRCVHKWIPFSPLTVWYLGSPAPLSRLCLSLLTVFLCCTRHVSPCVFESTLPVLFHSLQERFAAWRLSPGHLCNFGYLHRIPKGCGITSLKLTMLVSAQMMMPN